MKTFICLILVSTLAFTFANKQQQRNNYYAKKPYQRPAAGSAKNFFKTSSASSHSSEETSKTVRLNRLIRTDGSYNYDFATSNGISRTEQGGVDGIIEGSSSYISPEGIEIKTSYIADETGYHPVGDHIPKIPDYILRSLEYIRRHPYIEKDYYTGKVKENSFNKKPLPFTTNPKTNIYNKNKKNHKKVNSSSSKNNSIYNSRH